MCLRKAVLNRLHRTHPGQDSKIDAAVYLKCRKMHRDVINLSQNCRWSTLYGKNIRLSKLFNSSKRLPKLSGPNEELQLDFAGPTIDKEGTKSYVLVPVYRFLKYPSTLITRSTGADKIIKFLRVSIQIHSIQKSIEWTSFQRLKTKKL